MLRKILKKLKKPKGIALVNVIVISFVLLIIGMVLIALILTSLKYIQRVQNHTAALAISEGGIDEAIRKISQHGNNPATGKPWADYETSGETIPVSDGEATYSIRKIDSEKREIISTGIINNVQRKVKVIVDSSVFLPPFKFAIFGEKGIDLNGNVKIVGGSVGPPGFGIFAQADIATNSIESAAINLNGTSNFLDGDIWVGPGGSTAVGSVVKISGSPTYGEIKSLAKKVRLDPALIPFGITTEEQLELSPHDEYHFRKRDYLFQKGTIGGHADTSISAQNATFFMDTREVYIYVTGNVYLKNMTIDFPSAPRPFWFIRSEIKLYILGTEDTKEIDIENLKTSDNEDIVFGIYTPKAKITLHNPSGQNFFYIGALVGETINVNAAKMKYDPDVIPKDLKRTPFQIISWEEIEV